MLRGFKRVTCPYCGHSFLAADIEDNATVAEIFSVEYFKKAEYFIPALAGIKYYP